jgi:hypothetical protein
MNDSSEMMTKNTTAETVAQRKGNTMVSNIALNEDETIITLKDLTDFIGVDHSKAMKKVEKLSEEPNFGLLAKTATINLNGLKVETYLLTKKQAIAVGAKLNNALLMKVIDKMEELEKERQSQTIQLPTNPMEILSLTYEALKNTNMELSEVKQDVELLKNDIVITPSQKRILGKTMKSKIMSFEPPSHLTGTLFKKGWSKLHDNFAVSSYMEIPRLRFDEAINIVNNLTLMDLVA